MRRIYEMPSAKELKEELRALRKESVKPVSRMRTSDVSAEIQRLKMYREETPASAVVPSVHPSKGKVKSAVENVKEAKASEFPVVPEDNGFKSPKRVPAVKATPKSAGMSKAEKLQKLLDLIGDER